MLGQSAWNDAEWSCTVEECVAEKWDSRKLAEYKAAFWTQDLTMFRFVILTPEIDRKVRHWEYRDSGRDCARARHPHPAPRRKRHDG
jgi:hypothetical protein